VKKLLTLLVLIGIGFVGWYGYSAYSQYKDSDYEVQGFLVCNPDKTICENSQHIHAYIEVNVCGKEVKFEKEKGRVDMQHTHKELNRIHWHARERVDPITLEPLDSKPRQLLSFLEQMEFEIPSSCDGKSTYSSLYVNGEFEQDGITYIWKDGDVLKLEVLATEVDN